MENRYPGLLIVYGHNYCMQAIALVRILKRHHVDHEWRDILAGPPEWQETVKSLVRGNLSVPTVIFPDGSVMVEPYPEQVLKKLGLELSTFTERLKKRLDDRLKAE